jgi:hypothetical protein
MRLSADQFADQLSPDRLSPDRRPFPCRGAMIMFADQDRYPAGHTSAAYAACGRCSRIGHALYRGVSVRLFSLTALRPEVTRVSCFLVLLT